MSWDSRFQSGQLSIRSVLIGCNLFEFVLAVSVLRIFQQVCFLYSDELLQANLPVTLGYLRN